MEHVQVQKNTQTLWPLQRESNKSTKLLDKGSRKTDHKAYQRAVGTEDLGSEEGIPDAPRKKTQEYQSDHVRGRRPCVRNDGLYVRHVKGAVVRTGYGFC